MSAVLDFATVRWLVHQALMTGDSQARASAPPPIIPNYNGPAHKYTNTWDMPNPNNMEAFGCNTDPATG